MASHTTIPPQKGKNMPEQIQEPTQGPPQDEVSTVEDREDDLRAREAALVSLTRGVDSRHKNTVDYSVSNNMLNAVAALRKVLTGKAPRHEQEKTIQESSTVGQTSAPLESCEVIKDGEQRYEVNKWSISQKGEGSHAPRQRRTVLQPFDLEYHERLKAFGSISTLDLSDVLPLLSLSPLSTSGSSDYDTASLRTTTPEPEASTTSVTQRHARFSEELGSQSNAQKDEDTDNEVERSAGLRPNDTRPLISSATLGVPLLPIRRPQTGKKR
ncbi:hypothetical protein F4801DRAFT_434761 [Xylaria longipes]|nr:hypothetical protein F4801DRAFT_434761 [Xylaria longipes]RYC58883.1 hypothetical protein CHU98_g7316 [Xylaria longipes]